MAESGDSFADRAMFLDDPRRAFLERDRLALRTFDARANQLHASGAGAAVFIANRENAGRDRG